MIVLAKNKEECIFESIVDGTGLRLVIFLAGCKHRCRGCHNPETWDINSGVMYSNEEIVNFIVDKYKKCNGYYKGITFSGGDPLLQKEELDNIIKDIREKLKEYNFDIWLYTGYNYEEVISFKVIKSIDVLVDGKFDLDKKSINYKFRGSYNQRIIYLKDGNVEKIL
ncbi:anaerobic ribonucleoside-triphosphate reductase activating protein [Clostridioides difficile]|uniref:anaerobic ribonucleoside-triphosphate reductase activating protein n=1 Tax=Clostridioides difficile TaxID=1496 RepID=UPI00202FDA66|nr:anaerobic ribonucleoside-triphosphate reductase activating protein [Clostridioides difficile]MCM0739659.1 anaerobic ribonucleoside-triphosphate reductase activating protein [Clostridioides difficile]MDI3075357.1 anaerobic ribonucleoside-triphosphate reductase activating protein [Clostridioides difficile]MDK3168195.1 anaerobic ribonucleoside-triphosphate reductase activating protein [Clostridioides difficile]HBF2930544.1 anaerobic ribonucleoside-triphosphate reductase activating protein [Clos